MDAERLSYANGIVIFHLRGKIFQNIESICVVKRNTIKRTISYSLNGVIVR